MDKKVLLVKEIKDLPEPIIEELLDFVRFLKAKIKKDKLNTVLLSESSFRKDWLKNEEDMAWRDL